jgi:hypothetical protein
MPLMHIVSLLVGFAAGVAAYVGFRWMSMDCTHHSDPPDWAPSWEREISDKSFNSSE